MYPASNAYKAAVYAPIRAAKAKVTFDITDVTAVGDIANIDTTTESSISDRQQLVNKIREQSYNLATCEPNRFKLDGSFCFADDNISENQEVGFCSSGLCGDDGAFDPYPTIIFEFDSNHSSVGLTITFDALQNEYAEEFSIVAYVGSEIIAIADVIDNTEVQCAYIGQFYQYRKIEIIIKKWCKPFRRARVCEVDFGVIKIYEDNNLIKMSLIEEVDLITSRVPSPEFKFTVDNLNREFNILNPQGFYKFLQQRQQVIAELGIETGNVTEYIPLGKYLLQDWTSDEGSLTASFSARTNLDIMSSFEYENTTPKDDYTLYQMAVEIFACCGITEYEIDTALQSVYTLGLVKKTNCKNILQMIAIAACANVYVNRSSEIVIKVSPISIGGSVDTIDMDNMYTEPQIELDKILKSAEVACYADLDTKASVVSNNGTVSMGEALKLEANTLINTSSIAEDVANWIIRGKNYRAIYNINWRGNPAHEMNDIVMIEDGYGQNKNAFVTKTEITYQGYLQAKTEARGTTDVVD